MILYLIILLGLIPLILLVAYPIFSWVAASVYPKPVKSSESFMQPVSIIIAGYKEDKYLKEKVGSFLREGEWIEGSEIILVVSGATDDTLKILDEIGNEDKIRRLVYPGQVSKIESVNNAMKQASNEIVVFSDCRQQMKAGSVRMLLRNFSDPTIGTVVATLLDPDEKGRFSLLRSFLNAVALNDSKYGSSLNVFGALYAQRREFFRPFPTNILFEDLFVVVSTLVQGKRLIQERDAVIYDLNFNSYYKRERIERLARGLLLFLLEQRKLIGSMNLLDMLRFLLFKYAKLILPFSVLMVTVGFFSLLFEYQGLKSLLLLAGLIIPLMAFRKSRNFILLFLRINHHFVRMLFKFLFMHQRSTGWEKLKV
ncbi:MAG: glycosyltransferase [Bacteroidales bacterium]|nr:glycosyltransferase [Bacteroidales bacterium]